MAASFGIYFGGTSACIATCNDDKTSVIANDAGERVTPAVVAFTEHDKTVGVAAKQGLVRNAVNTICNVKRLLGLPFTDPQVERAIAAQPVKIVEKDGKPHYEVHFQEKQETFSAVEIATLIYKKMMETAESHGGASDIHDAVITVPIYFNPKQRKAVCEATTSAGFCPLRVINEPAAALLAYDIGQKDPQETLNVLVYRLGGTSLDITIMNVTSGMYQVVSATSNQELGGRHLDHLVVEYFATEFQKKWRCDCRENKRSLAKLRNAAENCKHILSTMGTAQCSVDSLYEGIDFSCTLSRGRFEAISSSYLQKCVQPLSDVFSETKVKKDDIQKVIVCGGSGKIPLLQKYLQEYFPQAALLTSIPADEVMAIGAAKQAALLAASEEDELLRNEKDTEVPALSHAILIQKGDGTTSTVLPCFTPVPVHRQHKLQLSEDQTSACLCLLQAAPGEQPTGLATVCLNDVTPGASLTASFHVKGDGSLHVSLSEPKSNKTEKLVVDAS